MNTATWIIPQQLLPKSVQIMRSHGRLGNEGIALWMGTSEGSKRRVSHVIDLYGKGIQRSPLNISISLSAMEALTDYASDHGMHLIGQIHSHPKNYTDLSRVDRTHGIRFDGYLSIVCPHYAQNPETTLSECGVHVFEHGAYQMLRDEETLLRITYEDSPLTVVAMEVGQ